MKPKDLIYLSDAYNHLINSPSNKNFWPKYFTFHKPNAGNLNSKYGRFELLLDVGGKIHQGER